jgi:hypothetical protein
LSAYGKPEKNKHVLERVDSAQPTEYAARILKLRLPEQDALKNEPDVAWLTRVCWHRTLCPPTGSNQTKGRSWFLCSLYTVKEANPDTDLSDGRAYVVRAGQAGRERLGTSAEIETAVEVAEGERALAR